MKKITSLILVIAIILVSGCTKNPTYGERISQAIEKTTSWKNENLEASAGDSVYDWFAYGTGISGNPDSEYVVSAEKIFSDDMIITDKERIAIAAKANGADISANGMLDSIVSDLKSKPLTERMINHLIFGLMVLENQPIENTLKEDLISEILSRQIDSGALYMINKNTSETDITAMAVHALSPYMEDEKVSKAVNLMIDYLSTQVTSECSVKNWGEASCETTAQTIIAVCSVGANPMTDSRFTKGEKNLIDGLLSYQQSNGGFAHTSGGTSDTYATAQAFYSLCFAFA